MESGGVNKIKLSFDVREHKQRMKEMAKTREWADDLTKKAHGKHHIGDFLPPNELQKFMEKA
jgi:splicing factor 4